MLAIGRRMGQGTLVLEHLAQVAAVDPTTARRALYKVFGLVRRLAADALAQDLAASDG